LESGVHVDWKTLTFRPVSRAEDINCFSTRGLFLRFADMLEIGGFRPWLLPHYASDYEYTLRARRKGFKFSTAPEVKLWGYEDERTTGIRSTQGMSVRQFLGAIFTKRALHNPLYWTTFVLLSCPWRYVPVNVLRVWRGFFRQARQALSARQRIGHIAGALRRRVQVPTDRWKAAHNLRAAIRRNGAPLRIIIGASGTAYAGWVQTEYPLVDVADWPTLRRFFESGSVSAMLAEHVWEHLSPSEAEAAARNCRELLAVGGHLRVAVPDGLHPDPAYIEYVRPGGSGAGSDDHKVLYTYRSLSALFERAGFSTRLLEWFDENGRFHSTAWDPKDGHVSRSTRFDERNRANPTAYTSIILDAVKTA
jgi:predicted SAM-dependent methyltransferase